MDLRSNFLTSTSKPQLTPKLIETHVPPGHPAPTASATAGIGPRPLSDIRELSEPSFIDALVQRSGNNLNPSVPKLQPSNSRANSLRNKPSLKHFESSKRPRQPVRNQRIHARSQSAGATSSSSYSNSTPERSSFYSIPHSSVPRRSSSQGHRQARGGGSLRTHARKPSVRVTPPPPLPPPLPPPSRPVFEGLTIPNRGP